MAVNFNNLNNIDLANIGDLPKIVKMIIIAIACVAIVVGIFFTLNQPQIDTLTIAQQKEVELKSDFEAKQAKAANLDAYKKQLAEMKKTFGTLLHRLPSKTQVPGLLEDISGAGVTSGLKIEIFKPLPEKEFDFYAELPIEITAIGNYHKFAEFISKLASIDRIVTVHDFLISEVGQAGDKGASAKNFNTQIKQMETHAINAQNLNQNINDNLSIKITVKTYRYKEDTGDSIKKSSKKLPANTKAKGDK